MDWGPLIATHSCVADATSTQQSNDHHSQEITPDWMPESHFVNQSLMALHGYHADRPFWHLHSSDALTLPSYAETRTPWRRQENPWHISKMFHATIKIGINVIAPTFQSRCVTGNATAVCWWCKGRDGMLPNRKGSRKLRHRALMLHHDLISGKSVAAILNQLNSSTPIDWHSKLQSTAELLHSVQSASPQEHSLSKLLIYASHFDTSEHLSMGLQWCNFICDSVHECELCPEF